MTTLTRQWWARFLVGFAVPLNVAAHVWLTPMHLDEKFYVGVLFCVGNAALLVGLALLLTARGAIAGWLLIAATAAVEFSLYIASRTVGLPGGYLESWIGEFEDVLGFVSLATDVTLVYAAALCLRFRRAGDVGARV